MSGVVIPSNGTCGTIPSGDSKSLNLSFIWIFNGLQIFGFFAVAGLTLTAFFSSRIKRGVTWYSFMIGWILWCISHFALIGQQTGSCPAFGFCLFQAALVYAGPPANACATLAILLQVWQSPAEEHHFCGAAGAADVPQQLVAAPPVTYVLVFVVTIVYGSFNSADVQRSTTGMFCNLDGGIPTRISAVLVAIFCVTMLIYELRTFNILYKNWFALRQLQSNKQNNVPVTMIVRISIFSFMPIVALGLSVLAVLPTKDSHKENVLANLITASLSGAAALIFGTQRDLLRAMIFCRRCKCKSAPKKTYADKGVSVRVSVTVEDNDIV
ncbi:hypothetical protein EV368DRAFT_88041 [Lentinula lateritia]|nr:hypothetical protein EV368DRAFT_88041 [Lentinula lateritia]